MIGLIGSLITYDAFVEPEGRDALQGKVFVSFGSQIGNVFVRGSVFAGRVEPLESAAHWFHLFNPNDHVFTAPLDFGAFQTAENFSQVVTRFGSFFSSFSANMTT